jgi:hypothetical protein
MTVKQPLFARVVSLFLVLVLCPIGTTVADDGKARELIQRMGAAIAGLESFVITGDGYFDARHSDGFLVARSADVKLQLNRPGSMHLVRRSIDSTKEIYFEDRVLTVISQPENLYARETIGSDVGAAAEYAVDELGIDAPMLDFVLNDVAANLVADAESVMYLGQSRFRGNVYEHIAIRMQAADVQLWIAAEGAPLPGKLSITSRLLAKSPRSVYFLQWDTEADIDQAAFRFEPPDGSAEIEFDRDWLLAGQAE